MLIKDINNIAIKYKKKHISYSQLNNNINYYSKIIKKSITKKSFHSKLPKIMLFSENKPEWIYTLYAIWKENFTVVPVDFMSTADEVAYIIKDCRPDIIIHSKDLKKTILNALKISKCKSTLLNLNINFKHKTKTDKKEKEEIKYDINFPKEKTALIIYTSGTTGQPKGVMLSFKNIFFNLKAVCDDMPIFNSTETTMLFLPLHHIFPLLGAVIAPLYSGGTIAICPSLKSEDILCTLQQNMVTLIIGVPRFYSMIIGGVMDKINASAATKAIFSIAKVLKNKSFSKKIFKKVHQKFGGKIKYLISGGAALDPKIGHGFSILGFNILEGYGMTETSPMITFTRPKRIKIGSPGHALKGVDIRIQDGEITVSGNNVMQGYYNRKKETADILKKGWLYTGDLGKIDKKGFLYITGRKKEIVVLPNGKNINPVEIENKLENATNTIKESAVFLNNDTINVLLVPNYTHIPKENKNINSDYYEEIINNYNKKVSPYKKIQQVHISDEDLPRTRLAKLKRHKLIEIINLNDKKKEMEDNNETKSFKIIKKYLDKETGATVRADSSFKLGIGLDSLGMVQFFTFLKVTFGVEINEMSLSKFSNIKSLTKHIDKNRQYIKEKKIEWKKILNEKNKLKLPKTWFTINIIKNIFKIPLRLYFRIKLKGTKKLPKGACLLVANHQSYFDGLFISIFLKNKITKNTYFYAKAKHLKSHFLKFIADRNNVVIMNKKIELKESIQKIAKILKEGKKIMIFPEGTRTENGSLGKFKKIFAILSKELNAPIIPITINGAYQAMPKGSILPKPFKKIEVIFSKAIYPKNLTYDQLVTKVRTVINKKLRKNN